MDPKIYESLGIDSTDEKKSGNKELTSDGLFKDENQLVTIANVILILGIISSIILLFTSVFITVEGRYSFANKTIINWSGLVQLFATLLFSIGSWAFLKVISNISISLKELNKKGL